MRRYVLLFTAATALVALAAACGGDSETDEAAPAVETVAAEAPADATPAAETPTTVEAQLVAGEPGSRETVSVTVAGNDVQLTVVLPDNFLAGEPHPTLLAFPPGGQAQSQVDFGLDAYWASEAQRRGWIVVSPVAPEGTLFFQGSEAIVPELLDTIAATYPPEGGLFHVGGISNGGLSSFRVAINSPERFASVVVLPGFAPTAGDVEKLDRLAGIPVRMFVGENDPQWVEGGETAQAALEASGGDVSLTIAPGEGHIIQSLSGAELFDLLDAARS